MKNNKMNINNELVRTRTSLKLWQKFVLIIIASAVIYGQGQVIVGNGAMQPYGYEVFKAVHNSNVSAYISSINVLPVAEVRQICNRSDALACTISEFNDTTNKFEYANIYISNPEDFSGCITFKHTLFHEVGHVEYSYYFGAGGSAAERERYADKYADRFVKNVCSYYETIGI
jgi:hypothetical protein